ncbi:modification methylase [Nocardioides sp. JQ2195]|uniref:adenine-specific methyltransferase EcoRI family protein n=1 Tax=Nocardioides sp. JQ2195 TaxID=2592334 RepID=UPI00143E3A83|nr:adenine-specific methyltransferase EcoRI family protein [Nocardioides sp. JQ2195]QIX25180.1 modification methylase [Nocardioides sp. JQ2195]
MAGTSSKQRSLGDAKAAKDDEFYTQLSDIEKELRHYRKHFKGKVVYLNCDDPRESEFFHYFSYNFEKLGLKKLIAACYKSQNMDLFSTEDSEQAVYLEYDGDKDGDRIPGRDEIEVQTFEGDGDFRSEESIALLKQADVVVTNPPFSLFREYVAQLIEHDKKFLIIGNMNAVAYKEIWSHIKANRLWLGVTRTGTGQMWFRVNEDFPVKSGQKVGNDGHRYQTIGNTAWFTNLDHAKRHEELTLFKTYSPEEFPRFDNFDAIEVAKTVNIPVDYDGVMGVPVTFLGKYNPDQFEILGTDESDYPPTKTYKGKSKVVDGVPVRSNTGSGGAYIRADSFGPGTFFDVGYPLRRTYKRIFIRRKGVAS